VLRLDARCEMAANGELTAVMQIPDQDLRFRRVEGHQDRKKDQQPPPRPEARRAVEPTAKAPGIGGRGGGERGHGSLV